MPIQVEAQITGNVWKIERGVGEAVKEEDVLIVLESMKMEVPVEAPCDGRIREMLVREGDAVQEGAVIAIIE